MKGKNIAEDIDNDYDIDYKNILGRGGFGFVYKGKDKKTGELVAVKKLEFNNENIDEIQNEFKI